MNNSKYLVFPHPTMGGMTNLLMELEIRVVLAKLSNRILVSPNKHPCWPQIDDHLYNRFRVATMLDLFDLPVKHVSLTKMYKNGFDTLNELSWQGECASMAYFDCGDEKFDRNTLDCFRELRTQRWAFPDDESDAWFAMNQRRTFSNYSYFFLAKEKKRKQIRSIVGRIQPKNCYLDLAKKISSSIGRYNAIHVRRGDFKNWWIKSPTSEELYENARAMFSLDQILLVCTDNTHDDNIFEKIIKNYSEPIFIDKFIEQEFARELEELPFNDATVIALLSQLVTGNAIDFAGSPFSTFTAAIHRRRGIKNIKQPMQFIYNPFLASQMQMKNGQFVERKNGPYSWNRFDFPNPPEARANAWFREWPEAIL